MLKKATSSFAYEHAALMHRRFNSEVQDEYLKGVADEHVIVEVNDIPIRANVSQSGKGHC